MSQNRQPLPVARPIDEDGEPRRYENERPVARRRPTPVWVWLVLAGGVVFWMFVGLAVVVVGAKGPPADKPTYPEMANKLRGWSNIDLHKYYGTPDRQSYGGVNADYYYADMARDEKTGETIGLHLRLHHGHVIQVLPWE